MSSRPAGSGQEGRCPSLGRRRSGNSRIHPGRTTEADAERPPKSGSSTRVLTVMKFLWLIARRQEMAGFNRGASFPEYPFRPAALLLEARPPNFNESAGVDRLAAWADSFNMFLAHCAPLDHSLREEAVDTLIVWAKATLPLPDGIGAGWTKSCALFPTASLVGDPNRSSPSLSPCPFTSHPSPVPPWISLLKRMNSSPARRRSPVPAAAVKLDDGLVYPIPERSSPLNRPLRRPRDSAGLDAYLVEVLEPGMTRRGSVHELLQGTLATINRARACLYRSLHNARDTTEPAGRSPAKIEPIFSVISCSDPVQLGLLLDRYKHPVLLPSPNQIQRENSVARCISQI